MSFYISVEPQILEEGIEWRCSGITYGNVQMAAGVTRWWKGQGTVQNEAELKFSSCLETTPSAPADRCHGTMPTNCC